MLHCAETISSISSFQILLILFCFLFYKLVNFVTQNNKFLKGKEVMGEIDTKPIDPVQVALSLFGKRIEERKSNPTNKYKECIEKERELENLLKDLAIVRVQLEAKDLAHRQALHELDELTMLLHNSDIEKQIYINESKQAKIRIHELESTLNDTKLREEYEASARKAKIEHLKKELESTLAKNAEWRARAEHAISRAEAAEKAKTGLEERIKKWKDQKMKRKAALAALREESRMQAKVMDNSFTTHDDGYEYKEYQTLGKVLNMKF